MKINPTIPIPAKVTAIHGITDEDVKDAPRFSEIAKSLDPRFLKVVILPDTIPINSIFPCWLKNFCAQDADIDLKKRKFVDIQVIFHKKEQRTLSAAYKFYCDKDLINAHSAEADTMATYEILKAQLDRYSDLPNDVDEFRNIHARTGMLIFWDGLFLMKKDMKSLILANIKDNGWMKF